MLRRTVSHTGRLFCQEKVVLLDRSFHPAAEPGLAERLVQRDLGGLVVVGHALHVAVDLREVVAGVELVPRGGEQTEHLSLAQMRCIATVLLPSRRVDQLHRLR